MGKVAKEPQDTSPEPEAAAPVAPPAPKPGERIWYVPTSFTAENGQRIADDQSMSVALQELGLVLKRAGGVAQVAAVRRDYPADPVAGTPPRTETDQLVIRWHQYVPKAAPSAVEAAPEGS